MLLDFLDVIQNLMLLPVARTRAKMKGIKTQLGIIRDQCHDHLWYCERPGQSVLNLGTHQDGEIPATGNIRVSKRHPMKEYPLIV